MSFVMSISNLYERFVIRLTKAIQVNILSLIIMTTGGTATGGGAIGGGATGRRAAQMGK